MIPSRSKNHTLTSTYVLDDMPLSLFQANQTQTSLYRQTFYQSPLLQDGPHSLVITFTSQGSLFVLDYIIVTSAIGLSSTSAQATQTMSSVSPPSTIASHNAPSTTIGASPHRVTVIVGAVLGTIGFLLVITLLALFFLRRRRRVAQEKYDQVRSRNNIGGSL